MDFDYRRFLRDELQARKTRNEAYSLRAFARDLNISLTALHEVIHFRRHLSRKNLERVRVSLGWSEDQYKKAATVIRDRISLRVRNARSADWHHHAILNLSKTNCPADPKWIGDRLGIDTSAALSALERLMRLQLVVVENGLLMRESSYAKIS